MRLPFQRKPNTYLWLENASAEHIMLHLDSGDLRLDKGRKLRFRPDVLEQPQVKDLIEDQRVIAHTTK